jgi:hypothetical protein
MQSPSGLWSITGYFNPLCYRRRLANYRLFRRQLTVPLVAVELSFGADFELREGDADILIQLRGADVMWQKERLLNIAVAALPPACRKVVWLDCDLIFARPDWHREAAELLDRFSLIQCFGRVHHLHRDTTPQEIGRARPLFSQPSLVAAIAAGQPARRCLATATARREGACSAGLAWGARRDLLAKHGLFDACTIGGGDTAFACAAYGAFEEVVRLHAMNDWQRDFYHRWAEPFSRAVGGVSLVHGDVFHLWHGSMSDRRPRERHEGLRPFQFNPMEDIALAATGCWRWNTPKPAMHRYVRDYFAGRKEDG